MWWIVMVNDGDGNTGAETCVGPFRSEAVAMQTEGRIRRRLEAAGSNSRADVVQLVPAADVDERICDHGITLGRGADERCAECGRAEGSAD